MFYYYFFLCSIFVSGYNNLGHGTFFIKIATRTIFRVLLCAKNKSKSLKTLKHFLELMRFISHPILPTGRYFFFFFFFVSLFRSATRIYLTVIVSLLSWYILDFRFDCFHFFCLPAGTRFQVGNNRN